MKNSIAGWLRAAGNRVSSGEPPAREGQDSLALQVLVSHVLARPRAWMLAHPESELTPEQLERLNGLAAQLAQGVPLPYLTGEQEFFGLAFHVTPAVLIPRPETELLVEQALEWLRAHPEKRTAADIGTGSGCIAVTLAKHIPDLRMLAIDLSPEALEAAQKNAARHEVQEQITFRRGDLLDGLDSRLDLICANLPYIPHPSLAGLDVAKHEPSLALNGGADGLELIRRLLKNAPDRLAPGGMILLEIQYDQGDAVRMLAREVFPGAQVEILRDLAGLDRTVRVVTRWWSPSGGHPEVLCKRDQDEN
jgi:release factor glutamine methyltransferase